MQCTQPLNHLANAAELSATAVLNKSFKYVTVVALVAIYAVTTGCGNDDATNEEAALDKPLSLANADASDPQDDQQSAAPKGNPTLNLVPANAYAFMGNTEAVPMARIVNDMQPYLGEVVAKSVAIHREIIEKAMATTNDADSDGAKSDNAFTAISNDFMLSYLDGYLAFSKDPSGFLDNFGINADAVNYAAYLSGATPILRIELNDPDKFAQAINEFVEKNEFAKRIEATGESSDIQLIQLSLPKDDGDNVSVTSSIEVADNIATFALSFDQDPATLDTLRLADGQQSIVDSGKLDSIKKKYGYTDVGIGFIDFQHLATMLTDPASESGSKFIASLDATDAAKLKDIQTLECQTEFSRLAEVWPGATMGYKNFGKSGDRYDMQAHFAVELNQPEISAALAMLRGHIPASIRNSEGLMSFALGLDAGKLGAALSEFVNLLSNVNYQCPALSGMNQKSIASMQTGVGQLAMFSAFVDGIRGVGVTVFDGGDDTYNGLATIAATDTGKLLNMAKAFPPVADIEIPADGTAVNVAHKLDGLVDSDMPVSLSDLSIAQRDGQILLFAGAEAKTLAATASDTVEDSNGFFYMSGTGEFFKSMASGIGASASASVDTNDKDAEAAMEIFGEIASLYPNMNFDYRIDFSDHGIEFDVGYDFDTRSLNEQ